MVFESYIGQPLVKYYIDSKVSEEKVIRDIHSSKYNRLYTFDKEERKQSIVVGVSKNTLSCISVDSNKTNISYYSINNSHHRHDKTDIQHIEMLSSSYLIVCTHTTFYRLSI